jgi:hypothetical protein
MINVICIVCVLMPQIRGHPLGGITLLDLEEKHLLDTHNRSSSNNSSSSSSSSSTPRRLQRHYRDANSSSTSSAALDCCAASAAMRRQRRALDLQVAASSCLYREFCQTNAYAEPAHVLVGRVTSL